MRLLNSPKNNPLVIFKTFGFLEFFSSFATMEQTIFKPTKKEEKTTMEIFLVYETKLTTTIKIKITRSRRRRRRDTVRFFRFWLESHTTTDTIIKNKSKINRNDKQCESMETQHCCFSCCFCFSLLLRLLLLFSLTCNVKHFVLLLVYFSSAAFNFSFIFSFYNHLLLADLHMK